jgi:hypothetical protein
MASSFNLIRDSRVFFTTNVDTFGVVQSSGFLSGAYGTGNTWEIQVQDGFSFSQNTTTETVTLNEAGATPNRGQRNFNTALEAVDFSFSTYMRPRDAGAVIDAEEGVLWNAMFSAAPIPAITLSGVTYTGLSGTFSCTSNSSIAVGNIVNISGTATGGSAVTGLSPGIYYIIATNNPTNFTLSSSAGGPALSSLGGGTSTTGLTFTHTVVAGANAWQPGANSAVCSLTNSGKHQLQQFGLIISLGGTTFVIDNCVMDSATIDFGLDAIASIAWAGKGSTLRQLGNSPTLSNNTSTSVVTFTPSTSTLTGLTVNNTTGSFNCASNSTLAVGGAVVVPSGASAALTAGTYYVISTSGPTQFTLGATPTSVIGVTTTVASISGVSFTYTAPGSLTGTANWKNTSAPYLANKLSTVYLDEGIGSGSTQYTVALTGGNLTFANNVTYLTPANLGVVNTPIVYFTGTRAVSGTMNAYLRTGSTNTAGLLASMLNSSATSTDPAFYMKLSIGGGSSAACRVDIEMPAVMLTIPTVATEQVVSTTISFTAQGSSSSAFDIEQLNEATITYVAPQV